MTDFYLTLPSNTPSLENKTSNFSVHLPSKLNLEGKWEVALVEIQYPHSWNNVFGSTANVLADNWIDVVFKNDFIATVYVPPGHYATIHDLLAGIEYGKHNTQESLMNGYKQLRKKPKENSKKQFQLLPTHIKDVLDGFFFTFDDTIKRVRFKKWDSKVKNIEISEKLQYMLGFEHRNFYQDKQLGKYMPDLRGGFYSLYIYCSLVEPQIVGNVTAPLLRNVHIEGQYGDIVEKIYHSPHYVPVIAKEVDRIEIDIKDDKNQSVPFQFGKTVVKLHFRKKRMLL